MEGKIFFLCYTRRYENAPITDLQVVFGVSTSKQRKSAQSILDGDVRLGQAWLPVAGTEAACSDLQGRTGNISCLLHNSNPSPSPKTNA